MKLLITGAAGFIGSAVMRAAFARGHEAVGFDALTYAAVPGSLDGVDAPLITGDIRDADALAKAFADHSPDAVLHLAAESHVDRSIDGPGDFITTNLVGTYTLLEAVRAADIRLIHVSTDEVFGDLSATDLAFTETTPYAPSSPYSASKAGSDHLVRAWGRTYSMDTLITNCSNNYGPRQHPEKLIPTVILSALHGAPIPVYGTGENIRDWLFVDDHAHALIDAVERGVAGETYLIGGRAERTNLDVVKTLCALMDEAHPKGAPHSDLISFVTDRPGHDRRYAINPDHTESSLGWTPATAFDEGMARTVAWYLSNTEWWQPVVSGGRLAERLGLSA